MPQVELDAIDHRIIDILQQKGRISNLELAEQVGLSPTPCSRRLKRLEDTGVISGYGARINQAALGFGITAIITVRLVHHTPADVRTFVSGVRSNPEITECLWMAGDIDYLLRVRVRDVDALKKLVQNVQQIKSVSQTSTGLVFEATKSVDAL